MLIEFTDDEYNELVTFMDDDSYETVQDAILSAVRLAREEKSNDILSE